MKSLCLLLVVFVAATQAVKLTDLKPKDRTMPTVPKPQSEERIIGGNEASLGQFPYQVALDIDNLYFCGGSLISDTVVLTAAHCVDGSLTWDVTAGALVMSNTAEEGRVTITTTNAKMHESYNANTITNDIALLILPIPASGPNIASVRLPSYSMDAEDKTGQVMRVSGWGKSSDASTTINDNLKFVDVSVITNLECRRNYLIGISSTNICTSSNGGTEATCNGDSGGPLVQDVNAEPVVFGIVSFGSSSGCQTNYPSAYTRVTKYLDWISTNSGIPIDP